MEVFTLIIAIIIIYLIYLLIDTISTLRNEVKEMKDKCIKTNKKEVFTQNKTKDQLTFLAGEGEPTQPEQDAFEEAIRHGDGSGFMDFPNLKLLFRGVLYDFLMRNGTITFQIEKSANVHSRCQTRGSRRLDGKIKYTYSKRGKLVLEKVMLERPTCWHKKLANEHPSARATL